ncbi:PREDICTED: alpha-1,2-mannosyltransferase ALG9 [Dufourea novaeangliae]|uniref:Mannosyltransferase n=1 Tax=Dufourea novaeangliae TaxID=178035 RepID=A0A154PNU2_DUFNO|nr:PREDICTED: alpha-1,2-mannosyltransferase ALG9 [Dufourea novaeangliae]KZC13529.1 Alpha-1,2-mannosyltransferase ALG9 [Dufourea novaeangliae]
MAPNQRQRQLFVSKKELKKLNGRRFSKPEESSDAGLIYPGVDTAFKLILSARFCSAIWSHITDCDEAYNYWEPSHYLLYGTGQQTWEYSPQYALRSYVYLLIHMVPAKLYHYLLEPNPALVFYFVRCLLSVGCALSEVYFYKNVCREFGIHIGRLTLVFLIVSSGMYIASAAFLPSSFSMYLSTVAIAAWYGRQYELAIFATAISTLLGWPFAALLGFPIAMEMLIQKQEWSKFMKWVIISAAVILIPMVWIDSMYYGKLVIAPLNIVMYNVFTNHGPNLYGTEPLSYYIYNGFLNFNFIFIGALWAPFGLLLVWMFVPARPRDRQCLSYWYSLAPLYCWLLVFFFQPHKEERFLFPVYPMICLAGAVAVDVVQKLYFFIRRKFNRLHISYHYLQYTIHITLLTILICGFLGVSRSLAIYKGYYAPMGIMIETNKLGSEGEMPKDININFCIGKEWHRFPSSFFFPSNNWKLQYLKSEFKGQLPQPFLGHENATSVIQPNFNDMNREEPSRYFNLEKCHFILDLDIGTETPLEPNYSQLSDNFTVIKSSKFLDTARSHQFFRAFYIPFISYKFCTYGSYNLLQNTKFKPISHSMKEKNTKSS